MLELLEYYNKINDIIVFYEDFINQEKYLTSDLFIHDVVYDWEQDPLPNDGINVPKLEYFINLRNELSNIKNNSKINIFYDGVYKDYEFFVCVIDKKSKQENWNVLISDISHYYVVSNELIGEPFKVENDSVVQDRNLVFDKLVLLYNKYKDIPFCKQYIIYLDSLFEKLENNEIIKIEPFYYE